MLPIVLDFNNTASSENPSCATVQNFSEIKQSFTELLEPFSVLLFKSSTRFLEFGLGYKALGMKLGTGACRKKLISLTTYYFFVMRQYV